MAGRVSAFPLLGRDKQLAELLERLERVSRGSGDRVLIEGEAGVGKTRLLDECLSEAEKRGLQVFRGTAGELEHDRPFGAVAHALDIRIRSEDPDRAQIAALLRGEGPEDSSQGPGLRFRVLEDLVALVERLAQHAPLAIALEDLHWADPSTLVCVHHLAQRISPLPVLLIGTFRPSPHVPELERVVDGLGALGGLHHVLRPLDPASVEALARAVLEETPSESLLGHLDAAGGNPFFVIELITTLLQEGSIQATAGVADLRQKSLPPALRLVILRHLSFLPKGALEVLKRASILGTSFSLADLSVTLGRPASDLIRALDEGLRAGVLGEAGERLTFRHDLVREALYGDMPLTMRRALHREVGGKLAAAGASAQQVATHFSLGATPGDGEAVDWLTRAAIEAAPSAPDVAIPLFRRAMELVSATEPAHGALTSELIKSLTWSGQLLEAERLSREALARGEKDSILASRLRRGLGETLLLQGRMKEAREELERSGRIAGLPSIEVARSLAQAAIAALLSADLDGAEALARETQESSPEHEDRMPECLALSTLAWTANLRGRFQDAIDLGARSVELVERSASADASRRNPHFFQAVFLLRVDRVDEAERMLRRGREVAEQVGSLWDLPLEHWLMALRHFWSGNWEDSRAEIETGLRLTEEIETQIGRVSPYSLLAHLSIHRDELDEAERALTAAERVLETSGPQFGWNWMVWGRALLHEARGEITQAAATVEGVRGLSESLGMTGDATLTGPDGVRIALAAGDRELARRIVEDAQRTAGSGFPNIEGAVLLCGGLLDDDPDPLLLAVNELRKGSRHIVRATACEEAAAALTRRGRGEEAVPLLREALEVYEHAEAMRDVRRAEAALRALGVRRGRRGHRRRPATGWESLTDSERQVVRLVGDGLTNKQIGERLFTSRRTVETHLSHVFAKLGLSSRVEVAAGAARHLP